MDRSYGSPCGSSFERQIIRDNATAKLRDFAKEYIAFEFAAEALRKEGIDIPEDLHYSDNSVKFGKTKEKIGKIVAQAKGLTIEDASPKLRKAILKDSKEFRDMNIGWEYFDKVCQQQQKRILDKDVEHIHDNPHYFKGINIPEIVEKIKTREGQAPLTKNNDGINR